jgi:hypothetical protein
MTEEDFLKRWSRRKREADAVKTVAPPNATEAAPAAVAKTAATPAFDPATLPPLESINALTDVTAFLRDGVPVELTRAALRRVWTSDPAIRDFVGLSENAWDFTDPNAMPGFGPLESTEEIRRMIARVVDQIGEAGHAEMAEVRESARDSNALSATGQNNVSAKPSASTPALPHENAAADSGSEVVLQSSKEDDAAQRDVAEEETKRKQFSQRTHGSALPR